MRSLLSAGMLLLAGTGIAQAQTGPQPGAAAPAASPAPVDPARLAVATRVVARLVPQGIYQKMFDTVFTGMMDQMFGQLGDMPIGEVARIGGISEEKAKALGDARLGEILAIYDPAWKERQRRSAQAVAKGMGEVMNKLEPGVRNALAKAYAREFTAAELEDLDRFFATPVGAHYAAQSLVIAMGPDMTQAMGEMMPEMMSAMPVLMQRVQEATADLPPQRKIGDLSPTERKKLAELLGVDPETLEDPAPEATGTE